MRSGPVLLLAVLSAAGPSPASRTSLAHHKPAADCVTPDDSAFAAAFAAADTVDVPAGCYGISSLEIPEGRTLRAHPGPAVLLSVDPGSNRAVRMGSRSRIQGVDLVAGPRSARDGIRLAPDGVEMEVLDCSVKGFRYGVHADNVNRPAAPGRSGARIEGCRIADAGTGLEIDFSRNVRCLRNEIVGSRRSAILAWGNYSDSATPKFTSMRCSDIEITGNRAVQSEHAPEGIWATGCKGVVITGNYVENARDVGIDMEWVEGGLIAGNVVKNAVNGCIALFYSCRNVAIRDNVIYHGHGVQTWDAKGWWASAGIWLTSPDRKEFPGDMGHHGIEISGNTVHCDGKPGFERRAMWIGREVGDARVFENKAVGACRQYQGDPAQRFAGNTILHKGKLSAYPPAWAAPAPLEAGAPSRARFQPMDTAGSASE